jgi:hypothetical protein
MSTSASAAIINLDDYRNRLKAKAQAQAEAGITPQSPVVWCMVWFAPVFLVQPYALAPSR